MAHANTHGTHIWHIHTAHTHGTYTHHTHVAHTHGTHTHTHTHTTTHTAPHTHTQRTHSTHTHTRTDEICISILMKPICGNLYPCNVFIIKCVLEFKDT